MKICEVLDLSIKICEVLFIKTCEVHQGKEEGGMYFTSV